MNNSLAEADPKSSERSRSEVHSGEIYPRFLSEVVMIPTGDKLVVDGFARPLALTGGAVTQLLPQLIQQLTGRESLAAIEARLPQVPPGHVREAVLALQREGLVESLSHPLPLAGEDHPSLQFLRRWAPFNKLNESGDSAFEKLQHSTVILLTTASKPVGCNLQSLLEDAGVPNILEISPAELSRWDVTAANLFPSSVLCVSLLDGNAAHEELRIVDNLCAERGWRWLHYQAGDASFKIGPMFQHLLVPCFDCYLHMQSSSDISPTEDLAAPSTAMGHLLWGLLATEIIFMLTGAGCLLTGDSYRHFNAEGSVIATGKVLRRAGCPACNPLQQEDLPATTSAEFVLSYAFEQQVETASLDLAGQRDPAIMQLRANPDSETRSFPNLRSIALPRALPRLETGILTLLQDPPGVGQAIQLNDLASILLLSTGIRHARERKGGQASRWCATAGNLGSVEPCLVIRHVDGIEPGYYFYNQRNHTLSAAEWRQESPSVDAFLEEVLGCNLEIRPAAVLIFVGSFARLRVKYKNFGYRLLHMDGGAALAQAHMVAAGLHVCARTEFDWNPALIQEVFRLTAGEEVTGMMSFWHLPPTQTISPVSTGPACSIAAISGELPATSEDALSQLRDCNGRPVTRIPPISQSPSPTTNLGAMTERISIGAPLSGGRLLGEVLSQRASIRSYLPRNVSASQVATLLHYALGKDWLEQPQARKDNFPLKFYVLARSVQDLSPAVYSYHVQDGSLCWHAPLPGQQQLRKLFVQSEFAASPLIVWIAGDLLCAVTARGTFGHRELLVRAGCAANRMWLAAMGTGLVGAIVAGLINGEARRQLRLDGVRAASLLALSIGHPQTPRR